MIHKYTQKLKNKKKHKTINKTKSKTINKIKTINKNKSKNKSKKLLKGGGKTSSSLKKKTYTASPATSRAASRAISRAESSTLSPIKSLSFGKTSPIRPSFKMPQKTIIEKMKESEERKIIEEQIQIEIQSFIDLFFENLKISHFPEALCALYKLYTLFPYEEVKSQIYSPDFKKKYQDTFYFKKNKLNSFGIMHCDFEAKNNYIYFLSYLFKKIAEGASIICDGKELPFLYSSDKDTPSILSILKQFLGYLDTACVTTISYTIPSEKYDLYNRIVQGLEPVSRYGELTNAEIALAQIISSLYSLIPIFPSLEDILENMILYNVDGTIASYSMNTTVLSRFIKQSYTDFLESMPEVREVEEVGIIEEVD